jgi:Asp-tRNA(Asn)/Glu-tRNA(Gln) amidotransferase A subunit family amidase
VVVTVPAAESRGLAPSSVIEDEFVPARAAWLSGSPYLDGRLRTRDRDDYRRRLLGRNRLRSALVALMDEFDLDALAYPTTIAAPAGRGVRQPTGNCWLAADSGLPALAVPGAIVRGFPSIGIDLLGRLSDESTLLALARLLPPVPRPPGA